jgi:hypothetical protein
LTAPELIYQDHASEVWLGDSCDPEHVAAILGDRRPDALIVDAPYSARTHQAHEAGRATAEKAVKYIPKRPHTDPGVYRYNQRKAAKGEGRRALNYSAWSSSDVERFVDLWAPLTSGWICSLTDHILFPHWESSLTCNDRAAFAPIAFVESGSRVRMAGDGPACWACWVCVARPRTREVANWGALPGAYVVPAERRFNSAAGTDRLVGGKPISGMLKIVDDYSRHGDLVIEPCCGAGTTIVAARILGRRTIGIDRMREHCEIAAQRVSEAREQTRMLEVVAAPEQSELFK